MWMLSASRRSRWLRAVEFICCTRRSTWGLRALYVCYSVRKASRVGMPRSEEHTSELQSLMRISYAVFCLKEQGFTDRAKIDRTTQATDGRCPLLIFPSLGPPQPVERARTTIRHQL